MTEVRVGVDIVEVSEVAESLAHFGDRYLNRVFSKAELASVGDVSAVNVASCFAAKEAAIKALGDVESLDWRSIEVIGCTEKTAAFDRSGGRVRPNARCLQLDHHHIGDKASRLRRCARGGRVVTRCLTCRSVDARIRHVVRDHARLTVDPWTLADSADLYDAGMTSHASVNLMLALEDEFDVEFPDELLTRSVFSSIAVDQERDRRLASRRSANATDARSSS